MKLRDQTHTHTHTHTHPCPTLGLSECTLGKKNKIIQGLEPKCALASVTVVGQEINFLSIQHDGMCYLISQRSFWFSLRSVWDIPFHTSGLLLVKVTLPFLFFSFHYCIVWVHPWKWLAHSSSSPGGLLFVASISLSLSLAKHLGSLFFSRNRYTSFESRPTVSWELLFTEQCVQWLNFSESDSLNFWTSNLT